MARGEGTKWLRLLVYPTRKGCMVRVLLRHHAGRGATDRILAGLDIDLGERLSMDEPGPLLLALSDALAQAADRYAS